MRTPTPTRVHCPACRAPRPARRVGTATVHGQNHDLLQCLDKACELIWAHRPHTPTAAPAAA